MSGMAQETLRQHLSACQKLYRDTVSVIENLHHPFHRETTYAVDFSEIYSIVFPDKTAHEMRVFDEEDKAERLVQLSALQYIFYENPSRPALLPAYGVELRSLVSRIRAGMLNDVIQHALEAHGQLERVLALPDVDKLLKVVVSDMTEEKVREAWTLFEQHAGALLLLTQDVPKPLRRILDLLQEKRIVDVPFQDLKHYTDEDVRDRWFRQLFKLRGPEKAGASYLDAEAMATAHGLNREHRGRFRLVIVTRSSAMHDVFDQEFHEHLWDDAGGYVLRHPRTFGPLYRRFEDEKKLEEELTQRQLSLRIFIDAAKRVHSAEALQPDEAEWFVNQLNEIRESWKQSETLSSASLIELARADPDEIRSKRERLTITLQMLREREEFNRILQERLSELLVGIERHHESLGFALQTERTTLDHAIGDVRSQTHDGTVILGSARYWLPYKLEFVSSELADWVETLHGSGEVKWNEIVQFLQAGFRSDADYERLLAMSYLLASLNRWVAAEQFCDRAINQPITVHRHEGHYFLAICLRMHQESADRYSKALDHIDTARNTKRSFKNDDACEDARYLAEKGTQILQWNRDEKKHHWPHRAPRPVEAKNLWERALKVAEADSSLRLQLHNNLCFYHCEVDENFDEQSLRAHLNQIVKIQNATESDMAKWNPLVLDTVARARLRLHAVRPDYRHLHEIGHALKKALVHHELLPKQKQTLEETIARIDEALSQEQPAAVAPLP